MIRNAIALIYCFAIIKSIFQSILEKTNPDIHCLVSFNPRPTRFQEGVIRSVIGGVRTGVPGRSPASLHIPDEVGQQVVFDVALLRLALLEAAEPHDGG